MLMLLRTCHRPACQTLAFYFNMPKIIEKCFAIIIFHNFVYHSLNRMKTAECEFSIIIISTLVFNKDSISTFYGWEGAEGVYCWSEELCNMDINNMSMTEDLVSMNCDCYPSFKHTHMVLLLFTFAVR